MPSSSSQVWPTSLLEQAVDAYRPRATDQPVTSAAFGRLARRILEDGLRLLATTGSGATCEISGVQILSAGMRSVILRVSLRGFTAPSVVFKYFRRKDSATNSGGFGYLREKHGLAALEQVAPGLYPRLLAADDANRLLILEDVISGFSSAISLGELLQSAGADAAPRQALDAWVDTWASILGSPVQAAAQATFAAELASADVRASTPGSLPSPQLALKGLPPVVQAAKVALGSAEYAVWERRVLGIVYPADGEAVLSSGDFSPANLLMDGSATSTVRGVDAEGTCLHHWALPVAEFLLGFPSWPAGPVPAALRESRIWQEAARSFYQKIAPHPCSKITDDKSVEAAQITIKAILVEQRC